MAHLFQTFQIFSLTRCYSKIHPINQGVTQTRYLGKRIAGQRTLLQRLSDYQHRGGRQPLNSYSYLPSYLASAYESSKTFL